MFHPEGPLERSPKIVDEALHERGEMNPNAHDQLRGTTNVKGSKFKPLNEQGKALSSSLSWAWFEGITHILSMGSTMVNPLLYSHP